MTGGAPPGWEDLGRRHLWLPYTQMQTAAAPLPVAAAEGARLILADGRELVDGVASWWTACHGYNHPHIGARVGDQLGVLAHVMLGGLTHEPAATLADRLASLLPEGLEHVFFSESGSVAVEIAMKMAIQYWINRGVRGRTRFVAFRHAYHGDTFAAMSVCDPVEGMHALFAGALAPQHIAALPEDDDSAAAFADLLAQRNDEIAAVIVEPLAQGAGGMKFHDPETLARVAAIAGAHQIPLIADEVFTGFGRTGTLFACEQAAIRPDIVCLSKALTGGTLPLAATVASKEIFASFLSEDPARALMHGPTFMGNPLACAAANASLDLFETEPRLARAGAIGEFLDAALDPLRGLAGVVDLRCRGAIGVVELDRPADADWFTARFVADGVWLRPFGNIVYTTPPLIVDDGALGRIADAMVAAVTEWSRGQR